MEAFVTRKKRKASSSSNEVGCVEDREEESTDVKLALLSSLCPNVPQDVLLDVLLAHDGSVSEAATYLRLPTPVAKPGGQVGSQTSLRSFATAPSTERSQSPSPKKARLLSRKGATLHLFDPEDISQHTPCTIIHNFLAPDEANDLLRELLEESKSYERITFKLFDNVVSSPHTSSFYVGSVDEMNRQKLEYLYNGARLTVTNRQPSWALGFVG